MQSPNSFTRHVVCTHTVTVAGVALDLYPPPAGPGWRTPAAPIFDIASIPESDRLDIVDRLHLRATHGWEIAWDHPTPIALLSRYAVATVLANAVAAVDPATVAAIDAALAG